jgi:8-oxo-dGTP pyrophosphatase MutT (NUDIX family)
MSSRRPRSRWRGGKRPARELSAGGVVVRGEEIVVIVPTRRASDGSRVVALPKGHIDPGENALQAATREVREETVSFFLFEYVEGDIADHDDEVEEARWIALDDAQGELSHAAEREMVARAAEFLEEERKAR